MTFAGSIFLIALGAILRFATHLHVKGLDLKTIGLILMIAGVVGLVIAIWQWAVWSRRSRQAESWSMTAARWTRTTNRRRPGSIASHPSKRPRPISSSNIVRRRFAK